MAATAGQPVRASDTSGFEDRIFALEEGPIIAAKAFSGGPSASTSTPVPLAAWNSGPTAIHFRDQQIYKIEISIDNYSSTGADNMYDNQIFVYAEINNTSSQQLGSCRMPAAGGASSVNRGFATFYVHNISGAALDKTMGLGVAKLTGTTAVMSSGLLVVYWVAPITGLESTSLTALSSVSLT
jgi:hypothetical protein